MGMRDSRKTRCFNEDVVELDGIEPSTSTLPVPKLRVTTIHNEPQSYIDFGAQRKLQGLDATE